MKPIRRPAAIVSILTVLLLLTGAVVLAQKGTSIVTRIKFPPGRTTAIERGSVHRGMSHDYLVKARGGQTMTVHLASRDGVMDFDILITHDSMARGVRDWSGKLPRSGDYRINVLPDTTTERSIPYTLEVTVR